MAGTMAQILKAFGEAMKRRRVVKRRTYRRKARGDGEEADGMLAGRKRRVVKRRTYRRKARGDGEEADGMLAGRRTRKVLSPYNKFVSKYMRQGYSMAQVAKLWHQQGH